MTDNQLEVFDGCLLGDGYLEKGSRSKNARFRFKQKQTRVEYVKYIRDVFGDFTKGKINTEKARSPSRVNGKISHDKNYWNGKFTYASYFWTLASEEFTSQWRRWYPNGNKKIPSDVCLTHTSLSHWFMQDGNNNITLDSKGIWLATNCFETNDLEAIVQKLFLSFNIKSKIYSGPNLRITAGSYFDFMDIVKPIVQIFPCFKYKIDTSKAPANRTGKGWLGPKLSYKIAEEIRVIRKTTSMTLKEIAIKYDVATCTIGKIVNNQIYPCKTPKLGGSALFRVGFNA